MKHWPVFLAVLGFMAGAAFMPVTTAEAGQDVFTNARTTVTEVALSSGGTEVSLSDSAGTLATESVDILFHNTSGDTTEAYWKIKQTWAGSVAANGATLTASTGMILVENVSAALVLDWSGADGKLYILSGGNRQ